jgi:uncharacterized protein
MADKPLKAAVHAQMVQSMKAGSKDRTQVLRMVLSEINSQEADKPDADPQVAVTSYAKKLRKAQADMERLHQPERVAALQAEIAIVDEFMPKQLDDAALEALVAATIAALPGVTAKESGKVVGLVMKAAAGSADATKVRTLVATKLPA